ncbi:thaumatin-like protein [Amborella trichopoda]|uniref:Thaumatin-like protein n=1 Tax=Amborella trichopoda TaxID=13333 RepID=W1PUH4_AMBTC|nr:thaumatin-like protein [Amborella trichopoda]ERN11698.1 hypothetical protein AMTR_s00022p00227010 [Amborella trichopoda]|eukprot:XP_006850117.1 thaumatin-like protein [Amborella trichopoda]
MALRFLIFFLLISFTGGAVFTLKNNCRYTVWPGIQPGSGHPVLANGGFSLHPNLSVSVTAPNNWSGRFWPRTSCHFDQNGIGKCVTGDCGTGLQCTGTGGAPPASLAEFTLNAPVDFYDVSLVDGYNIPVSIFPSLTAKGSAECHAVQCVGDLNKRCPKALQMVQGGRLVGCKSACLAFGTPEYCCTGAYASPSTCQASRYAKAFKAACPTSYSYAYDDATSTFTCPGADYTIKFC